jgi:hypothetical protein
MFSISNPQTELQQSAPSALADEQLTSALADEQLASVEHHDCDDLSDDLSRNPELWHVDYDQGGTVENVEHILEEDQFLALSEAAEEILGTVGAIEDVEKDQSVEHFGEKNCSTSNLECLSSSTSSTSTTAASTLACPCGCGFLLEVPVGACFRKLSTPSTPSASASAPVEKRTVGRPRKYANERESLQAKATYQREYQQKRRAALEREREAVKTLPDNGLPSPGLLITPMDVSKVSLLPTPENPEIEAYREERQRVVELLASANLPSKHLETTAMPITWQANPAPKFAHHPDLPPTPPLPENFYTVGQLWSVALGKCRIFFRVPIAQDASAMHQRTARACESIEYRENYVASLIDFIKQWAQHAIKFHYGEADPLVVRNIEIPEAYVKKQRRMEGITQKALKEREREQERADRFAFLKDKQPAKDLFAQESQ